MADVNNNGGNNPKNLMDAAARFKVTNSGNVSKVDGSGDTKKTPEKSDIRSNANASGNNGSGINNLAVGMLKAQGFSTKPDLKIITGGSNNVIDAESKFQKTGNEQVDKMLGSFDDPLKFAELVLEAERSGAGDIFPVSAMDQALNKALAKRDGITSSELERAKEGTQNDLKFPSNPGLTPDEEAQKAIKTFNNKAA